MPEEAAPLKQNAEISHIAELQGHLHEVSASLEAGANVLELEPNEDIAELRSAWESLREGATRARSAAADLLDRRQQVPAPAPLVHVRSPIDDEA